MEIIIFVELHFGKLQVIGMYTYFLLLHFCKHYIHTYFCKNHEFRVSIIIAFAYFVLDYPKRTTWMMLWSNNKLYKHASLYMKMFSVNKWKLKFGVMCPCVVKLTYYCWRVLIIEEKDFPHINTLLWQWNIAVKCIECFQFYDSSIWILINTIR